MSEVPTYLAKLDLYQIVVWPIFNMLLNNDGDYDYISNTNIIKIWNNKSM